MSWEQYAVFILVMLTVNILSRLVERGLFEGNNRRGSEGNEGNEENDGSVYVAQQVISNRIMDVWREINYLRGEMEKKVNESVCKVKMEKLEVVIEEIKKRLESIEGKIDRILGKKEG